MSLELKISPSYWALFGSTDNAIASISFKGLVIVCIADWFLESKVLDF